MRVSDQGGCRERPALTPLAFNRLLQWLDAGVDSQGERYLEMRRRLVLYFDRRNRPAAEELADETLGRVSRTLEEAGTIETTPPARYCYVVARFVLLEDLRHERRQVQLDEARADVVEQAANLVEPDDERTAREQRLDSLDRCLQKLPSEQRELVVEYYRDERRQGIDHRRRMAERLGISRNALGVRAFRIRETLMNCVTCRCGEQRPM
jgi:RNA polymerase sigma factor (sigma-70 family)